MDIETPALRFAPAGATKRGRTAGIPFQSARIAHWSATGMENMPKKATVIDIAFLLAGLLSLLLSLCASIVSGEGAWFQRSGSLLVLFSVILEIRQERAMLPQANSFSKINRKPILVERTISSLNKWLRYIAWAGIIGGTFVWGYGDLIFV